ncbi:MAG: Rab family GTPase [Promethearchaeota archaeon]
MVKNIREIFKVFIGGDIGVGKTTFLGDRVEKAVVSDTALTVGVDFYWKKVEIGENHYKLQLWDFLGGEKFQNLLSYYVTGSRGVLLFYDITNPSSFNNIDDWLEVIRKQVGTEKNAPIIMLVGNKTDLDDTRQVSAEDGKIFAKSREIQGFIECSAKTGKNVSSIFNSLTQLMVKKFV